MKANSNAQEYVTLGTYGFIILFNLSQYYVIYYSLFWSCFDFCWLPDLIYDKFFLSLFFNVNQGSSLISPLLNVQLISRSS